MIQGRLMVKKTGRRDAVIQSLFGLGLGIGLWMGWGMTLVAADERAEELAGEQDTVPTRSAAPISQEPVTPRAGEGQKRPILKLPEVIVQGDRQYRVTAERRDLLLMDPMWGTKEMPDDLKKVAIPGLQAEKGAPGADTVTAKNYLVLLEAGAGNSQQLEGRVVGGFDLEGINALLRGEYLSGASPEAFGIVPYDQQGNADLDVGFDVNSSTQLSTGMSYRESVSRQPHTSAFDWGEWLDCRSGTARLRGSLQWGPRTKMEARGFLGQFAQNGDSPLSFQTRFGEVAVDWRQGIPAFSHGEMELLVFAQYAFQNIEAIPPDVSTSVRSETYSRVQLQTRFRPISVMHLDVGVNWNELDGVQDKNSSTLIGRISFLLPTGSTLYGQMDGGLKWRPVQEWAFEQPRPTRCGLPRAEKVEAEYRIGWRQSYGENVSSDCAWFSRETNDSPVWLDGDRDGLFSLAVLSEALVDGASLNLELRVPTTPLSIETGYVYRRTREVRQGIYPYLPEHEGRMTWRWEMDAWSAAVTARYLGERFSSPEEKNPSLSSVVLLGMDADLRITEFLDLYARFENMLGSRWEKWPGYAERGMALLGGLRIRF